MQKTALAASGLILGSLFFAGCSNPAQQAQQAVSQTVQQAAGNLVSEADFAKITDPLVRKNFVAQANQRTFRTVMANSNRAAGDTTAEMQITGTKVAFHTSTVIGKNTQEMIMMGDVIYVKDPSGTWWKQTTPKASATPTTFKIPSPDEIKQQLTDKQNTAVFKAEGTEACGSLTCYKYVETDGGDASTAKTIWFDNQQFLTRKEEQTMGGDKITTTYSYDNISVTEPANAKDVPAGHSAFEYIMGAPTGDAGPSAPGAMSLSGARPAGIPAGVGTGKVPSQAEIDAMMKQAQDVAQQSGQ